MAMGAQGNILVKLSMFGWIPAVLLLFAKFKPRKAAAIAFCFAWMFLPVASFPLKGLPDYTKMTASCMGILAAAYLFDRRRLMGFRLKALDLPMLLWCTSPLLSSLSNGLGPYDGLSESMYQTVSWGMPYLVGRIYFADHDGLDTLTKTVFTGGLVYIPFCLVEIAISPQLHRLTYGYHQHSFLQTIRDGGFRPMVYMEHGLMTAMWMVTAAFLGVWLCAHGRLPKKMLAVPTVVLVAALVATTCILRSTGAVFLLFLALACLFAGKLFKTRIFLLILIVVPPIYITTRINGWWTGEGLSRFIAANLSEERAQSLQFRLDNEVILIEKAAYGGFFGWGGWGRSRVFDENGKDISVTDGLWIITLGTRGIYGLFWLNLAIVIPALMLLWRCPSKQLYSQSLAAPLALAAIMAIYMIDNLPNAMVNPVFMLFNGALAGLVLSRQNLMAAADLVKSPFAHLRFLSQPGIAGNHLSQPVLPKLIGAPRRTP